MPLHDFEKVNIRNVKRCLIPVRPAVRIVNRILSHNGRAAQTRRLHLPGQHIFIGLIEGRFRLPQSECENKRPKLQPVRNRLRHSATRAALADSEQMHVNVQKFFAGGVCFTLATACSGPQSKRCGQCQAGRQHLPPADQIRVCHVVHPHRDLSEALLFNGLSGNSRTIRTESSFVFCFTEPL